MNSSSFASVLLILFVVVVSGHFLRKRLFRYESFDEDGSTGFDEVFDEDGSLTLGTKELQLRTSESRRLNKETEMRSAIYSAYQQALEFQTIESALLLFDPVTIPTVIHVVKHTDSSIVNEAEGKEQEQIDVLNKAFLDNNMGFTFDLKAIRTHINSDFFNEPCPRCKGSLDYSPMARATHEGDSGVLNIWYNNGPPYGFAMMGPQWGEEKEHEGVVVRHTTVFGGSNPQKNMGTLLVHEVGHWLGLDHTFQGNSCSGVGDGVSDTAPQKRPTNTCSSTVMDVDTCDDGLPEDNSNFMNYVDDPCARTFTPGQALRSHITWKLAREGTSQFLSNVPTSRPTMNVPTGSLITAYPTRGLRENKDRERIRDEFSRPARPVVGMPPADPVVDETIPPVNPVVDETIPPVDPVVDETIPPSDAVREDTFNCPAVWPGDGTVCVMIEGFDRKKCTYWEYSGDSICTCSLDDLFWTCVNGPTEMGDFVDGLDLSASEDEIEILSLVGRTGPINRIP